MDINRFRGEHVSLMAAVTDLRKLVHSGVCEHADAIAHKLVAISAAIKLHLAAEDRMLYPMFAKTADARIADLGQAFQDEMGGIASAYAAFVSRWNIGAHIAGDPERFRGEANTVFKALHQRVQRENSELYPLAEQL